MSEQIRYVTVVSPEVFARLESELDEPAKPSTKMAAAVAQFRKRPHDHGHYVPGCFRCDLSRDEVS